LYFFERPPILPPWRCNFSRFLTTLVHTSGELNHWRFIRRVQTSRVPSTLDLTSHKNPKNLCERDALPTELYPRNSFSRQRLARKIRISSGLCPHPFCPLMIFGESTSVQKGWLIGRP
jgi:hypothetical protein